MAELTISGLNYLLPIWSYLLVFIVTFIVLYKTKIVEQRWLQLFVSFLVATIFISAAGGRVYVENIVPWFVILVVSFFLMLALVGLVGKPAENWGKGLGIAFMVLLFVAFLISAVHVFSPSLSALFPGSENYGEGLGEGALAFLDWIYSPNVLGVIVLLVIAALVSWVLVKMK